MESLLKALLNERKEERIADAVIACSNENGYFKGEDIFKYLSAFTTRMELVSADKDCLLQTFTKVVEPRLRIAILQKERLDTIYSRTAT